MNQSSKRKVFTFPNIAIGLVLMVLRVMLMSGPERAQIISVLIVCTAGVSLVIWVPLAAGLGWFVTELTLPIFRQKKFKVPQRPNLGATRREVLRQYIEQADSQGMERDNTISLLGKNGWKESEIEGALATIAGSR
jgi:hypothetical protein